MTQFRPRSTRSFSLLEIMVVAGLLFLAITFLLTLTVSAQKLGRESSERTAARSACYGMLGEVRSYLHSANVAGVTADYEALVLSIVNLTATTSTTGTVFTPTFAGTQTIDLITSSSGAKTQATVTITTFPNAATDGIDEAAANTALASLGVTNIDVDGDGATTGTDIKAADVRCIPVVISISWVPLTASGPNDTPATIQLGALLY